MEQNLLIKNPEKLGEVIDDLGKAISDAGGRIPLTELFNMSILEFLTNIATANGIRFYYNKKFSTELLPQPAKKRHPEDI